MRHLVKGRKLNRTSSHRSALMSNLSISLIKHKRIVTTEPKAKELRRFIERLITYAKKDNLHGRRLIMSKIKGSLKKEVANTLIHDIAPNYSDRNGGYTRIIKLANRKNDDASMSIIEFVNLQTNDSETDKKEEVKEDNKE
ncbi:MAG: 50S ribosomal protein L17 [Candidatus Marinimicrobia bacterium]|nr:50S ribosomal protein L17 [Candidatus Neomarinimicrobiota bacterium]